ncbi:pyridine nucleotide-disulfide oxidoreductase-like protein [Lasiosphaeria hispida]|uniref:Pyridine nucleotide-disulfide oxidoreductase-like protein n=1 Tax=Lasiosphaeria hispida TaxID=260671 RepID=A0AAJ0HQL7_9PEZI|nr:pyridine nucleotide-disulfide oxidoreductase-like protein [Lasiosphaeria hispida]
MASTTDSATAAPKAEDLKLFELSQKYTEEAAKRFRAEGSAQFLELHSAETERLRSLAEDPWVDHAALNAKDSPVKDGGRYKFLVLGAGFGGMLLAVRLIEAGVASGPNDLRVIDKAGGFGGTWWSNRYPGLHCDVESYSYMPLLEETGYMPKSRYASGPELLEHAGRIATQWNLHDKGLFRAAVQSAHWDDATSLWNIEIVESRGPAEPSRALRVQAEYFLTASGVLVRPHAPNIPGLASFAGPMFHTARWDYSVTGGTPQEPRLTGLEGKRVGIMGTGATAIQATPQLAKWAKELYVFQRTPSAVHYRAQRETDPEEWKTKIAYKKGWQRERMANLNSYLTNAPIEGQENMVNDAWTEMPAFCALVGCPKWGPIEPTPEKIGEHIARLHRLDVPHSESGRARVDEIVKDPETAAKLKAWYPTWCKRPTFNDDYLPTFNLPNVHLVDTAGKGIDSATEQGLVVGDKEYPIDVLVLSTGYRGPVEGDGNPEAQLQVEIRGRGGRSLGEKWTTQGASTLHGVATSGFPNMFFLSPTQSCSSANYTQSLEVWISHIVHIIAEAEAKASESSHAVINVTSEGEEGWAGVIMQHAVFFASLAGCTPGYINGEGAFAKMPESQEEMMKKARSGIWSSGMGTYEKFLEDYRSEGSLKGFEITTVA